MDKCKDYVEADAEPHLPISFELGTRNINIDGNTKASVLVPALHTV